VTYYFSTSGGRTENVENSFLGSDPAPWLVSVEDPFDSLSPRHRWMTRMSLRSAKHRLGSLLHGSLRQIKVEARGISPRVVRAEIVGTGGRTQVTGPQLRRKLDLYDTWARFTVITTRAARGDGSPPKDSAAGGGAPTGGTAPRAFAAVALPVAGTISGRVTPAAAGSAIAVERREATGWVMQFQVAAAAGGRYRAVVRRPGLYRIRHGGAAGPAVRVV
jgi:stage II sporulation protein D